MNIFKLLYARLTHQPHWKTIIQNGDLIRTCSLTGIMEYRDVTLRKWVAISNERDIDNLREKRGVY